MSIALDGSRSEFMFSKAMGREVHLATFAARCTFPRLEALDGFNQSDFVHRAFAFMALHIRNTCANDTLEYSRSRNSFAGIIILL